MGTGLVILGLSVFTIFLLKYLRRSREAVAATMDKIHIEKLMAEMIMETAPNAILTIDLERRITSWNRACTTITGYNEEDVLGRECGLISEDFCPGHVDPIHHEKTADLDGIHCNIKCKDGSSKVVSKSTAVIRDQKGEITGGIMSFNDVTERMRLEEQSNQFHQLLESTLIEIYVFDKKSLVIQQANKGACDNLGYTQDELGNLTPLDLMLGMTVETFAEIIEPLQTGEQTKIVFNSIQCRKDGSHYPVEIHLQVSGSELSLFTAITIDITRRQASEKQLLENQERLKVVIEATNLGVGTGTS